MDETPSTLCLSRHMKAGVQYFTPAILTQPLGAYRELRLGLARTPA